MNRGIRDYCKFISQSIGNAGNVYINVNKNDANLHLSIPLYVTKSTMPISLGLMFSLSDVNNPSVFGKGVYLNYFKEISLPTTSNDYTMSVKNPDGSIDLYTRVGSSNKYVNEETQSYILDAWDPNMVDLSQLHFYDKYGNKFIYNYHYLNYPILIEYVNGSIYEFSMEATSTSFPVITISNQKDETVTFTKINDFIDSINIQPANIQIKFEYENGFLEKIEHIQNGSTLFVNYYHFDLVNKIVEVIDGISGYRIKYTFDSNYRIIDFKDGYDASLVKGKKTSISYDTRLSTITNYKGEMHRIYFDFNDLLLYEIDDKARVIAYEFDSYKRLVSKSNIQDNRQSAVNKVTNGYFTNGLANWTKSGNGTAQIVEDNTNLYREILGASTLKLFNRNIASDVTTLKQDISINGNPTDKLTFIIWGKELYVSNTSTEFCASTRVLLKSKGEVVASSTIGFTKYASADAPWEYKTIGVASTKSFDCATIEITIKEAETSYLFDAIQLYVKPFGSFYKYNADGNIINSSLNHISNRLTYTEEEDGIKNLVKQSCGPDGSLYNYAYDDKANIESAKTAYGVTISNEYDSDNNLINVQIRNDENFFETSAEYELEVDDNNYANTKTDAAGNKVKFIFDKIDHKLIEYKDALETSTSFSYDDFGNIDIVTVSKGSESANINYTYNAKNQLDTAVLENGVVYKFNYDSINRLENISVGKTIEGATNILTEYKYYEDQDLIDETPVYTEKIHSKQYGGNGDIYYFNYNDDNQLDNVQLQKKGTTEKNIISNYSYNDKGLLSNYNDGTNNEDYYYDENTHLILLSNNESSIEYQYDNLESVCNKKYLTNGKNIVQSFDPIYRSKGLNPLTFFESIKTSSKYYNKYHCFFNEDRKINNITTKNALIMRALNSNQNIIEYGILPSKGGNLVPVHDGGIPCIKYKTISAERLSYPINMYKYPLPSLSVMFWFKQTFDNYSAQRYLFSIGTNVNSNFIGAYINSNKKVVLKLVDGNGVVYDSLITTNTPIELQKWNFFSLTWFNRNDGYNYPDVCEYELVLNDEYKKIVKEDPRYNVIPSNPCDINIGYCRSGASDLYKFIGHVTGLMVSNGFDMNPDEIFNYYRIGKEYIMESSYTDDNVKTVASSGTNLYNIDDDGTNILNKYDIIPLHNSLISVKGIRPSNMTIRETVSYDRDRTFNYNNVIKRYTYVADGAELTYKFNLSNSGTIALKTYINNSSDYQFLFQNVDSNNRTLGLLRGSNNILYIDFNGNRKSTGLILPNNVWKFVSFSWEKIISGGSLNAYAYNIKVLVDANIYETQIGASFIYRDFETSVGRRKDGRIQDNILYTDSLLGQIEMFTVRNAFLSTSTINNLKEKLKVVTFTKQFDEFELIKKKSITKDGQVILDHKYTYRNYLLAEECPTCNGRGIISNMCEYCEGTGYIEKPGGFTLVCGCGGLGYTEVDCSDCTDGLLYPTDTSRLTTLISNEDIKINSTNIRYEYIYDKNRNVTEIKENNNIKSKYKYDYKGYLKEETLNDRKMIYDYDDNGNIFSKQKVILSNNQTVNHNYIYDDQLWPDRLIGYGILGQEKEIRYDDNCLGNPTFYGTGTQGIYFSWEGKRLTHYTDNTQSLDIAYTYNDLGLRITKEKQGVITRYYYDGDKLINEITGTNKKYFLYDENDYLYGIIYNGVTYYYVRDILGNINGLVDKNGTLMVKYGYDSFGNLLSTTGSLSSTLGVENPFIYKGYYYDFETGLYLLTTRFYNPEWGRFLSADDISYLNPSSINGLNLFSYCNNNPIMYFDNMGTMPVRISQLYGNTFSSTTNLWGSPLNFFGETYGGGLIYSKNGNLSNCPNWLEIGAFYGEITPLIGLSLLKADIGIAKIGFKSNKFFSGDQNAIWNPNLFAEIGALTADGNIGVGISGKASVLSLSIGAELGNSLKISGTVYVGAGVSVDFSNGIKLGVGLGLGFEISAEFNWINTIKWIWE